MKSRRPARPYRVPIENLEGRLLYAATPQGAFAVETKLISNQPGVALLQDTNLQNAWGVSFAPGGPIWVSDNNAGVSTIYDLNGTSAPAVDLSTPTVTIPGGGSTAGNPVMGTPTGQVYTGGVGFPITANGHTANSLFVFVGEDGAITGWNPDVDATHAVIAIDNSANPTAATGAVYKGATLATVNGNTELFAANFRSGHIEAYDTSFSNVTPASGFSDRTIPKNYAPFNVQNIGGNLFVTYAKQNATKHDDVAGAGHGFVDVFNTSGQLIRRLQRGAFNNSPWGVTVAPSTWGRLAGDILVGQFGNGRIATFSPKNGLFLGMLRDNTNTMISIDGLWDVFPGNGGAGGDSNTIYFTAGPNGEVDGLLGALSFTSTLLKRTHSVTTTGGGGVTTPMFPY